MPQSLSAPLPTQTQARPYSFKCYYGAVRGILPLITYFGIFQITLAIESAAYKFPAASTATLDGRKPNPAGLVAGRGNVVTTPSVEILRMRRFSGSAT